MNRHTYPTKMMTLNYMIWLTSTKNILIPKLKQPILEKQKEILTSVKEKINSVLNPSKPEDYDPNLTKADIFNCLGITEEEYYNALSISPDSDFDLHLKRSLDSCFIKNYYSVA